MKKNRELLEEYLVKYFVTLLTKCRRKAPVLGHGDIRRPILLVF